MSERRTAVASAGMAEGSPPSHRIIESLAERTGRAIDELPQLYHVIDPEALDRLFESSLLDGHLSFEYADHVVTVYADGRIDIDTPN